MARKRRWFAWFQRSAKSAPRQERRPVRFESLEDRLLLHGAMQMSLQQGDQAAMIGSAIAGQGGTQAASGTRTQGQDQQRPQCAGMLGAQGGQSLGGTQQQGSAQQQGGLQSMGMMSSPNAQSLGTQQQMPGGRQNSFGTNSSPSQGAPQTNPNSAATMPQGNSAGQAQGNPQSATFGGQSRPTGQNSGSMIPGGNQQSSASDSIGSQTSGSGGCNALSGTQQGTDRSTESAGELATAASNPSGLSVAATDAFFYQLGGQQGGTTLGSNAPSNNNLLRMQGSR